MTALTVLPAPGLRARPRRRPVVAVPVVTPRTAVSGTVVAVRRLVSWAVLAAFAVAWSLIGLQAAGHVKLATVLTGSMAPDLPPGSVLIDQRLPVWQLQVGDVITYTAPAPHSYVVTHRVTSVERRPEGVVITTKGDGNPSDDPWQAVLREDHVWEVRAAVPYVGLVFQELRSSGARVVWSVVVPLVIGTWVVVSIWRPAGDTSRPTADSPRHARR